MSHIQKVCIEKNRRRKESKEFREKVQRARDFEDTPGIRGGVASHEKEGRWPRSCTHMLMDWWRVEGNVNLRIECKIVHQTSQAEVRLNSTKILNHMWFSQRDVR